MDQQFKHIHGYVTLKVSDLYEKLKGDPKEYAERLMYVMDRVSHQGKVGVVIEYDLPVLDHKWEVVRKILQDNHLNYQMYGCSRAGYIQY